MNKISSLVFFGSGPVAASSLRLLAQEFAIEAVITKPTTKYEMSEVLGGVPLHTVANKAELDDLIKNQRFSSSVGVLIDFGIIVSRHTIESFQFGIINSHFSLLPELRGADPISFAILEGKQETGVSLMLLVEAMDEGPIIAQDTIALQGTETTLSLTDSLIDLSFQLLKKNLSAYLNGEIMPQTQEELQKITQKQVSYTRKLSKNDSIIDWNKDAAAIEREIRAFSGWPKSRTTFGDIEATITAATVKNMSGTAGTLFIHEKQLAVYCGTGSLLIGTLTPMGKKSMGSEAFLIGYKQRLNIA